jgi:hypothetical protein
LEKKVECYSGVEYAEEPRKFLWQGKWRIVRQIAAENRTVNEKQFTIVDDAGEKFLLTYQFPEDRWEIRPAD